MQRSCRWSVIPILVFALSVLPTVVTYAVAQGVTASSIGGIVTDQQGQPVPGVTVEAVHGPSGTTYTAVTRADGRYALPGARVGGPYIVTAKLSGFQPQSRSGI